MKDLSMHIMDIAQNSVSAHASLIRIEIIEQAAKNSFRIIIEDNGKGMPAELASKVETLMLPHEQPGKLDSDCLF